MNQPGDKLDLSQHLTRLEARSDVAEVLKYSEPDAPVALDRGDELAAAAVALLVLERIAEGGGSAVPVRQLRALRDRVTRPFTSTDVMKFEVEAYRSLGWLAGLDPNPPPPPPPDVETEPGDDRVRYDANAPPIDLIRRAIAEDFDLDMTYYTQSRGQVNRRRVSPLHLQAETYLHAYCHSRRGERVFRISRIADIRPIDGVPVDQLPEEGQGSLEF